MNTEIHLNEEFGYNIFQTVIKYNLKRNIEIGSWDGEGSTKCFVNAMQLLGGDKKLICVEIIPEKYNILCDRYKHIDFVKPINASSISLKHLKVNSYEDVKNSIYNKIPDIYSDETIKSWFDRDYEMIKKYNEGVLDNVKNMWDSILIDGSEFTGYSEYFLIKDKVKIIFLDDVHKAYKCNQIYHELKNDPRWTLLLENEHIRNGYAIFKINI